jgi:hypothetical protein
MNGTAESQARKLRVNLRLAPGDYHVVKHVADQRGVSVQEVLRGCVGEWAIRYRVVENSQKASAMMETFLAEMESRGAAGQAGT